MSGHQLRRERERRGLTLDEVAEGARVPRQYLIALEEDDTDTLPPGPFLRSYRSQYLQFLGIDPATWADRGATGSAGPGGDASPALRPLDADLPAEPTATVTIPRSDELPVGRLVFLAFLLTLAIVLALRVGSTVADPSDEPEPTPVVAGEATQTIRVRAVEPTPVSVETDDSYHHTGVLGAGEVVEVESALPITVEVGDLTQVVIQHNGVRIEPLHNLSHPRRLVFIPE